MSDIINSLNVSEDEPIRPLDFKNYIGQEDIKRNLKIAIAGSKKRGHQLDHLLFYGPPGLGKTTISKIIANELKVNIKIVTGTSIEKAADLAMILMGIEEGDILFIDEIHRIPKIAEEAIYSAMEDYQLHINVNDGISINTLKIDLPKFTLIGATTRVGMLTKPLRDRFGLVFRLKYYSIEELTEIVINVSKKLNINIEENEAIEISKRSRFTPRIAIKILKRMRDFADFYDIDTINKKVLDDGFVSMNIFNNGLDEVDLDYLNLLSNEKAIALKTLTSKLNESIETIEESIEPYLLEMNYIEKSSRGRIITELGKKILLTI